MRNTCVEEGGRALQANHNQSLLVQWWFAMPPKHVEPLGPPCNACVDSHMTHAVIQIIEEG